MSNALTLARMRGPWTVALLLAVGLALACGRYGPPQRTRPTAAQRAPATATPAPASDPSAADPADGTASDFDAAEDEAEADDAASPGPETTP